MNRTIVIAALTVASTLAAAQTPSKPQGRVRETVPNTSAQQLQRLEEQRIRAMLQGDPVALETHLSPRFTLSLPQGQIISKRELINGVRSGKLRFRSLRLTNVETNVSSRAAVLTGYYEAVGNYKGRDISGRYHVTRAFVKRSGYGYIPTVQKDELHSQLIASK
jgi:Domain of unknown function (DUF4440)